MKLKIEYLDEEDLYDVSNLRIADMVIRLVKDTNFLITRNAPSLEELDMKTISQYISTETNLTNSKQ